MDAVLYDLVFKKNWVCEEFLVSGNFTAKSDIVFLEGCAGGGGGHTTGTGGAGGSACDWLAVPLEKGTTYDVAIGAGGAVGGDGGFTYLKKTGSLSYLVYLPGGKSGFSTTGSGIAYGGLASVGNVGGSTFPDKNMFNAYTVGSYVAGASVYYNDANTYCSGNNRFPAGSTLYTSGAGGYFGPGGTNGNAAAANSGAGGGTNAAGGSGIMRVYYLK